MKIDKSRSFATYKLIDDSVRIVIPSKKSASFSFKYSVSRPEHSIGGCEAWLKIIYIDPNTADKNQFAHSLFIDPY